jgi:proteinaceous RNase P
LSSLLCNIQNCDCSRLRSYSPALYTYCKHKIADKAFEVDEHMRAAGVRPEEAELEALLKLSVELGLEDKVYSLLHRLRATVREVSASTVGLVQQWFTSTAAVNAGKLNWSNLPQTNAVKEAVERGGGGWHGLGWLGKGPWEVNTSQLDEEGVCQTCGEQLVTIDLDPRETEMFAESLFKLACQREAKNNEFRKFQVRLIAVSDLGKQSSMLCLAQ